MKLNEVCEFIIDCEHKTAPLNAYGEYISIRTPNIGKGYFILEGVNRVTKDTYEKWTKRGKPKVGDLIMAREAPVGNVAVITNELNICLGQRTVLIRPDSNKTDSNFLCYYLLSDLAQNQIHGESTGATVAHLNMSDIRDIDLIGVPSLPIQQRIASILSAYDELIEVNNQRIKLLEETARELYKEWFVRLRFPGYKKAKFVKGIPEGWGMKSINEISSINSEMAAYKPEEEIKYLDISSVGTFKIESFVQFLFKDAPGRAKRIVRHGDIIFSTVRPENRSFALIQSPPKNLLASTGFAVVSPKENIPSSFVLNIISSDSFIEEMVNKSKGSAYPQVGFDDIRTFKIIVPALSIIKKYGLISDPILEQVHVLTEQNTHLRQIRDRLLPRLVSGKLQVKERSKIEEVVE